MARISKKLECRRLGCSLLAYSGGLCREHDEEQTYKDRLRSAAKDLLHTWSFDGGVTLTDERLRAELKALDPWWSLACWVLNSQIKNEKKMPLIEAEYALEWCISLAEQIVLVQRAIITGEKYSFRDLEHTHEWVWKRLGNLEAGLQSNGVPRS